MDANPPQPMMDRPQEAELIRQLADPGSYDHPVGPIRHVETHISHILLCGTFAYKIKKPLNLGFLDFSSLDQRYHACHEEVRLNRRLAPTLYLGVVPITGSPSRPRVNGAGTPFEYAVKMRQFPPDATLDHLEALGQLTSTQVEAIGTRIAGFHLQDCERAGADSPWGDPAQIGQAAAQNFEQIKVHLADRATHQQLDALQDWSESEHARLTPLMTTRKREGFIRECHGDLHLGNLAWVEDRLLVFDCLEFNPELRWIDIQSEIAFCVMDLMQHNHMDLAWLLLNTWLQETGDYAGLTLLRYYAVYRALVRAKVAVLRAIPASNGEQDAAVAEAGALLNLATKLTHPWPLRLNITHGLSGSGKTTITRALMQTPGAIRLRSDVERKRLAGLNSLAQSHAGIGQSVYAADFTRLTYTHLTRLAGDLLDAGWPVIVDATFTARWQRDLLRAAAQSRNVPFHILDFQMPVAALRKRILQRAQAGQDASEADLDVLRYQIETEEKLTAEEQGEVFTIHPSLRN